MKYCKFYLFTLFLSGLLVWIPPAHADEHEGHDVVIGLTDITNGQKITLVEDHALSITLEYNTVIGLYYGGQACWIPADGDLHIMADYGDGTPPANHYQLELVAVDMPESVIAFDSESYLEILNGSNYALDEWHWEMDEGWHFHNHISWGLDPALVTVGETVTADFKLIDSTGQYADSDVFAVTLTAVPEPTTLCLLGLGGFLLRRKPNVKRI